MIEPIDAQFDDVVDTFFRKSGKLIGSKMSVDQRIHEKDLYIPTLRIANSKAGGFITTSDLIGELEAVFNISGEDAEILDGRSDTKFSQIVRNMISHKNSESNFIAQGLAEHDEDKRGIRITSAGKEFLESLAD